MSFSLSLITSTGYPFIYLRISDEPPNTDLNMRFYAFVHQSISNCEKPDQSFELQAGLVSALYEFAKLLEHPIELLKFRTHPPVENLLEMEKIEPKIVAVDIPENSDVLLTTRTEIFLNPKNYEVKMNLIYNNVIKKHLPLGPEKRITDADEIFIKNLLMDSEARKKIEIHKTKLDDVCNITIEEYKSYGVEGLFITSFDMNPLESYGISLEYTRQALREIGIIPVVKEYQWLFRTSRLNNLDKSVFIINSGCGVKIENVFTPYYYILICKPDCFLGDSPTTIYQRINTILDE